MVKKWTHNDYHAFTVENQDSASSSVSNAYSHFYTEMFSSFGQYKIVEDPSKVVYIQKFNLGGKVLKKKTELNVTKNILNALELVNLLSSSRLIAHPCSSIVVLRKEQAHT